MAQSLWLKNCSIGLSSTTSLVEICKTLVAIMSQVKTQPSLAADILEHLYHPKATDLLHLLSRTDNEEFMICAAQCIDETLNAFCDTELTTTQIEVLDAIGGTLLHLYYASSKQLTSAKNNTLLLLASLSLLNKITTRCPNYAQMHISELLGIAKANVSFGLETINVIPERILPSDNLLYDSSAEELECENAEIEANARRSAGGRVPKKRKPRALAKSMQNNYQNQQQNQQNHRFQALTLNEIVSDLITSDSDASELENNPVDHRFPRAFSAHERQKHAKVRQMAIALLGTVVTRLQERRILYGYWHAFFENTKIPTSESLIRRRSDLLYIGLHDPNSKCRATALQIAGQLIFGSKNFLQQAECVIERLPTAFLPFAYSLGLQVVSIFEELTQVLKNESSILVLTQALKCLAVLVQATTPFQRFQPRDFVGAFVKEVQRLVTHRDETIQVAALMVLEFLITTPELTPEVAAAIGASEHIRKDKPLNDENEEDLDEIANSFDEYIQSESEDDTSIVFKVVDKNKQLYDTDASRLIAPRRESSWLLQCVLRNLGIDPLECGRSTSIYSTNSVRIESLQVLAAMAQHFSLLESQLDQTVIVIQRALLDSQIDLRFCAARCLDTIAYQIGRTLQENTTKANVTPTLTQKNCSQLEEECLNFWSKILPTIMAQIRSPTSDQAPTSNKVCLCDVLSNIGVVVFERQPYAVQMNLIGFLSGIACDSNEDATVRCAAVRALAVYVLFPSLCGNLVFVENAAELTLRLIGDTNILVRVKASWAMGNISDALLIKKGNTTDSVQLPERISDSLLWRLIISATEACNDNDKVRCNAVRTLGNLLRLLEPIHFNTQSSGSNDNRLLLQNAITKLIDCLRSNVSAKVKWNTCYAIGNLLQNTTLLSYGQTNNNFDWQSKLYSALANVIVHHPNFKVRINAASALTRVTTRSHFGVHYEKVWKALLKAIEQSHHLDNFYEYNHRDHLQEQLCLAICHILRCGQPDDFIVLYKHLEECVEIVRNTWTRVINRMVPEKSSPIVGCTAFLQQQLKNSNSSVTMEQRKAIVSIIAIFETK